MTDEQPKHHPVLGDTERPPKEPRMEHWLADAVKIRKAREEGKDVFVTQGGGIIIADADGPIDTVPA